MTNSPKIYKDLFSSNRGYLFCVGSVRGNLTQNSFSPGDLPLQPHAVWFLFLNSSSGPYSSSYWSTWKWAFLDERRLYPKSAGQVDFSFPTAWQNYRMHW